MQPVAVAVQTYPTDRCACTVVNAWENGQRRWMQCGCGTARAPGIDLSDVYAAKKAVEQFNDMFPPVVDKDGNRLEPPVKDEVETVKQKDVLDEQDQPKQDASSDDAPASGAEEPAPPTKARKGAPAGGKGRKARPSSKA